jgi:hypothetical protein
VWIPSRESTCLLGLTAVAAKHNLSALSIIAYDPKERRGVGGTRAKTASGTAFEDRDRCPDSRLSVNNGIMFVSTPYSQVIALDAATSQHLTVPVRSKGIRIERSRQFGDVYLALALWRVTGLAQLREELLPAGKGSMSRGRR